MVNGVFSIIFTAIINAAEYWLGYKLLSCKLKLREQPFLILGCFSMATILVTVLNFSSVNPNIRIMITFFVDVIIALVISKSDAAHTVFWGSMYTVICVVADTIVFQLGILFAGYSAIELLYEEPGCYIMTLIYLFFCYFFVFFFCKKESIPFSLPWYIQIWFVILLVLGIAAIELMLDLILDSSIVFSFVQKVLYYVIMVFLLLFFMSLILIRYIGKLYTSNLELIEENRQKQFEKQQYDLITATNETLRHWKHDLKNHMSVLRAMAEQENCADIENYLRSVDKELGKSAWMVRTGNTVIDAVLSSKLLKIQELGIEFTHVVFLPEGDPLGNIEWTSLLGNLLDNSIEACERYIKRFQQAGQYEDGKERPFILLEIKPYNQFLSIMISNSSCGNHRFGSGLKLISSKKEIGHGIGLKRVEHIVEDADGFLEIEPAEDSFQVTIVIPLKMEDAKAGGKIIVK